MTKTNKKNRRAQKQKCFVKTRSNVAVSAFQRSGGGFHDSRPKRRRQRGQDKRYDIEDSLNSV